MQSGVRGYVWKDKFYGTVVTRQDTLYIEPLSTTGPINSRLLFHSHYL